MPNTLPSYPEPWSLGGFRLSRDLKTQREQRVRVIARLHGERDAAPAEAERSVRTRARVGRDDRQLATDTPECSSRHARSRRPTRASRWQITAGRDHVIAAHPIVRANPDAFKAG